MKRFNKFINELYNVGDEWDNEDEEFDDDYYGNLENLDDLMKIAKMWKKMKIN